LLAQPAKIIPKIPNEEKAKINNRFNEFSNNASSKVKFMKLQLHKLIVREKIGALIKRI